MCSWVISSHEKLIGSGVIGKTRLPAVSMHGARLMCPHGIVHSAEMNSQNQLPYGGQQMTARTLRNDTFYTTQMY